MKEQSNTSGVLITFLSRWIMLPLSLVSAAVVARVLGPEGQGIIAWVIMVPTLTASVSSMGIGGAIKYLTRAKHWPLSQVITTTLILAFLLGGLGSVVLGILFLSGFLTDKGVSTTIFFLILSFVPVQIAVLYLNASLLAIKYFRQYNALSLAAHFFSPALTILFVGVFGWGVLGAASAIFLWMCMSVVLGLMILWRAGYKPARPSLAFIRAAFHYGLRSHIGTVMQKLNLRLDQLVLGFAFSSSMLGWYSLAIKLVELLNTIPNSIGDVLFPSVAGADREWAVRTTAWLLRVTLLTLVLASLILAFLARPFIVLVFGKEFEPSVIPLIVSLPGAILLGLTKVATKYIDGTGRPEISSACTAVGLVVGGAALVPLTLQWGLVGTAIASDLGYAALGIGVIWRFTKLTGLSLKSCLIPQWSDIEMIKKNVKKQASGFLGNYFLAKQ